jgi:hypothetical protein
VIHVHLGGDSELVTCLRDKAMKRLGHSYGDPKIVLWRSRACPTYSATMCSSLDPPVHLWGQGYCKELSGWKGP